ncbi:MAG: DUF1189 family protein [Legionella sp.]|nr:DUF1189 family protein [Legionella sp.]
MAKVKNKLKPIDAPVYRYWEALYMAFYSRNLFIDVGKRWKGFGLLYLLLLIAVLSIPFSLRLISDFNTTFNEQLINPLMQLPTVYVQKGQVTFDHPMPYLIKNNKDQVVLIVDTTGQIQTIDARYPNLSILITKDRIYYKIPTPQLFGMEESPPNPGVPMSQIFGKSTNMVFNGKQILEDNTITGLKFASQLLIYPVVIAILYSMFVIIFLVFGFLGQVFARIFFSFQISFKQSSRLFMVSVTPMMYLLMTILTLNFIFPGSGIIMLGLAVCYFSFAIFSLRQDSRRVTTV